MATTKPKCAVTLALARAQRRQLQQQSPPPPPPPPPLQPLTGAARKLAVLKSGGASHTATGQTPTLRSRAALNRVYACPG